MSVHVPMKNPYARIVSRIQLRLWKERREKYLKSKGGSKNLDCFCRSKILVKQGENPAVREEAKVSVVRYEMVYLDDRTTV